MQVIGVIKDEKEDELEEAKDLFKEGLKKDLPGY
jgi:hypothetical protein